MNAEADAGDTTSPRAATTLAPDSARSSGGESPSHASRPRPWWYVILKGVEHAFAIIGFLAVIYHGAFQVSQVHSSSMSPTLEGFDRTTGDYVLTERISYYFRKPRRWEVVAFHNREHGLVMKRVIGLPGESVQILRDGTITINGERQSLPAWMPNIRYLAIGNVFLDRPYHCGEDYYMLGDDTHDSDDSRYVGGIPPSEIVGRAWLILAPSGRQQFIK